MGKRQGSAGRSRKAAMLSPDAEPRSGRASEWERAAGGR